jgi:8-oxo-dGTP pyrophosphatase MutT (NUDIX family)
MSTDSPRERVHRDGYLTETSFGGVVVRERSGDERSARGRCELLVITPAGKRVTGLPKGGPNRGETPEQTAVREVREETGINATVREPLGDVRYWYRRGGRRVHKTVHFFLCDFVSGSTADHDHEVDEARWIPLTDAPHVLSYAGERALIERALSKLASGR